MKHVVIKNSEGQICDYRIPYDINIEEEIKNINELIKECHQKVIEITGINKDEYERRIFNRN